MSSPILYLYRTNKHNMQHKVLNINHVLNINKDKLTVSLLPSMRGKCLWFSVLQSLKDTAPFNQKPGFNSVTYCTHLQTAKAESPEVKCINEPAGRPWGMLHTFSFSITALAQTRLFFSLLSLSAFPASLQSSPQAPNPSNSLRTFTIQKVQFLFPCEASQCISLNRGVWYPQWSILLHMTTFSSFKFPFQTLSPSNNQPTAVYKIKAASSEYITATKLNTYLQWLKHLFYSTVILFSHSSVEIYWHPLTVLHFPFWAEGQSWQCLLRPLLISAACCNSCYWWLQTSASGELRRDHPQSSETRIEYKHSNQWTEM